MSLVQINSDLRQLKEILRRNGFPERLITSISTRALKSGRSRTGVFQSNRHSRWTLLFNHHIHGTDPQYGTEINCKKILIILLLTTLEFQNAPTIGDPLINELSLRYLNRNLIRESYKDILLLEKLNFEQLVAEINNPIHGTSNFHIGHLNPTLTPKHIPENITWRTLRSNLIQGNMTLKQSRIYFLKLIARYFELGEINID